ncbi:MAG: saccharopine dehydrogenase NADP-binding domain-containing protein [Lactobacillaceae bacterium]|jgi:homospermidine synthase|nr:saccharopine dehydrogenase NADP-binding domain-containing protein [Lactobacillaceae bacterium]
MKNFENDIVLFGFGAVGQSALVILEKEISFDKNKLTIIDKTAKPFDTKYKYVQAELFPGKQNEYFSPYVSKGGLLLDFSSDVDCIETIKWCYENGIMYLNTGDNEWPHNEWSNIYEHYIKNEAFFKDCADDAATIVIHHGANPGSVSHFAKLGLHDIAQELIDGTTDLDKTKLKKFLDEKKWGELAEYLEVRTIQSSDRDNQMMDPNTISSDTFYSTWNALTFYNESTCFAEARIGTTEKLSGKLDLKLYDPEYGAVEVNERGTRCFSKGWAPCGEYLGMIVGHEEDFSISDCLSVYNPDGSLRYRPTVYFCYRASDLGMESLRKAALNGYEEPKNMQLVKKGIVEGTEYVGVLIMGNKFKSRWVGNCLTLDWINKHFPGQTPTILQVSVPAVSAVSYMVENRNKGINYPDDLPYEEIVPLIEKYADKSISVTTDFTLEHDMEKDFVKKDIIDMFFENSPLSKVS